MISSMTGFGRGEVAADNLKAVIEMKSVNHRYCEIVLRMPRSMNVLEERIRRVIQEKIARGRVDVFVNIELLGANKPLVKVDEELAADYVRVANGIKDRLTLDGNVTVTELLHLPGVISLAEPENDVEQWWPVVREALAKALTGQLAMRLCEGDRLQKDIKNRSGQIGALVESIAQRSPLVTEEYREKLSQRLAELLAPGALDINRLETEVVIIAERASITEELVRLRSHLAQLDAAMESDVPVGRKLDFLMQEINREVNTIASKSADVQINRTVVEIKSVLEKIREQVQNIE
ncbi:MAG: YicC family protein [Firmicutes bacterium]|nr:YicC family protein [Bacillota bacterium]